MGGKGGSPPPAPDYSALAKEQGAANVEAAKQTAYLSNPNIVSPWSKQKVTYSTSYATPEPVKPTLGGTQMTRQQAEDYVQNQMGIAKGSRGSRDRSGNVYNNYEQSVQNVLGGKVKGAASYVDQDAYNKAMEKYNKDLADWKASGITTPTVEQGFGSPEQEAAWKAQQTANQRLAELGVSSIGRVEDVMGRGFDYTGPGIQTSIGDAGEIQGGPQLQTQLGSAGDITRGIDTSGLAAMPVNAGMTGQQAIMSRLQPQVQQERQQLETQLANQGITPGSEAYNRAMTSQNQRENDLLSQAALQGINLDMAARQQGFGESAASAGFMNQAQQQAYNQALATGNFENAAKIQQQSAANQAQAQKFNELLQKGQFANTADAQEFERQLGLYNLPLNQVSALMSGSQVAMPQFQGYQGAGVTAAPIFQAGQAQDQANMARYNAEQAGSNALTSGLFGVAGSALGGPLGGMLGKKLFG